jgi:hypothetical protein
MRSRRTLSRIGRYLLAIAIVGSAMALGSIHTAVLCVVATLVGGAACLAWFGAERVLVRPAATAVLMTGVGLTLYTLVQTIPLPASLVAAVAPHTADIWSRALTPLREPGPAWVSLSLDPIATRIEVLRGVSYIGAFLAALKITSRRDGSTFLATAIVAGGLLMAIAAVVHPAFGIVKVFGFYRPGPGIDPRHVAPLLNPNHLAAYLNVAFCVALAAAIAPEPALPRPFAFAAVFALAGTQLWVASRGGVLLMVVAATLVVWMSRVRAPDARSALPRAVPLLFVAIVSLAMIVFGTSRDAVVELASTDASKLSAVREMGRMIPTYWVFGAGRGSFESTFAEFRDGTTHAVFTHPETILVQWPAEWGLPIALAAAAALLLALWPRANVTRSYASIGAWVALATAAAHNLIDFSSEVPGVVLVLSVCAGIVVGGAPDHAPRTGLGRWSLRPRVPGVGIALLTAFGLAIAAPCIGRDLVADRDRLRLLALAQDTTVTAMHAVARQAMLRHPAEPYIPYAVALRASRMRDESVVPWTSHVLERAPVYGPAHYVLARSLASDFPSQARLEYRLSIEQEHGFIDVIVREIPRVVSSFDDAMELVPNGREDISMLNVLIASVDARLPATRVRLDEELSRRDPKARGPVERRLRDAVWALEAGDSAPWCLPESPRAKCLERVVALAKQLQAMAPSSCAAWALEARGRVAAGEGPDALRTLESATGRVTDRTACLRELVTLALEAHANEMVTRGLDQIAHAACADEAECVANLVFAAGAETQRGNPRHAYAMLKRAQSRTPENDDLTADAARLASSVDLHGEALDLYQKLAQKHPGDPRWAASARRERDALMRGMRKE